ncbi:MAG: hypothetical protein MJ091_07235, partial [Clostridia bacterium]|nr:hypothetical protein [Clostridia bacterium]
AVFIAGYVLLCTKLKITGGIVSIVSLPYMLWCFAKSMEDVLGLWGYKPSFYWRHLIPLALLFLFALIMTVIAVRQRVIFNREYNRITENLYEIYRTSGEFEGEDLAVSDEK